MNNPVPMAEDALLDRYKLFRQYIQNEDALVNHRTTWLIQIQAFLIATFGFSYQKKLEVYSRVCEAAAAGACKSGHALAEAIGGFATEYNLFMVILCGIGLVTAWISHTSVGAAQDAVRSLEEQWRSSFSASAKSANLPFITGGGHPDAPPKGFRFPVYLPRFFIGLWILLCGVIVAFNAGFRE